MPSDIVPHQDQTVHADIHAEHNNIEVLDYLLTQEDGVTQEDNADNEIVNDSSINKVDDYDSEITEITVVLGATSDPLFEIPETNQTSELLSKVLDDADNLDLEKITINAKQSGLNALNLNPDFDVEVESQIARDFNQQENRTTAIDKIDEQALNTSPTLANELEQEIDEPSELLQWLDDSSIRPSSVTNIAEVSADQDLLSWLGNDALDMAKLPIQPSITSNSIADLGILNDSAISSLDSPDIPHEPPTQDQSLDDEADQLLHKSYRDQASDSEESLILLTSRTANVEFPKWEDSLVNELSSDLERLDDGFGADPTITNSLDQFIRNTPYSAVKWETEESHTYPPKIIDISAKVSTAPNQQTLYESEVSAVIHNPD
ncbi:MAG: hypothetical protein ACKPCM_16560, partial [Pseudanabaena sp.]